MQKCGVKPQKNAYNSQNTADPLAQECCPCHTVYATGKHGGKLRDEQDIHADIGQGGKHQKVKWRSGIPQCGKDAGTQIVKKDKGDAVNIYFQIQCGIGKDILRRMNAGK